MSTNGALKMTQGLSDPDIEISYSFLNYLNSGFQGRFAFWNVLSRLGYPPEDDSRIRETRDSLRQINQWTNDLWQGGALINHLWQEPQTFPAQQAVELLQTLRNDYRTLAIDIIQTIQNTPDPVPHQDASFLVAAFGWFAYSKDNYARGFVEFGKRFTLPDLTEQFEHLLQLAEPDVHLVHSLMEQTLRQELPDELLDELFECIAPLPGAFFSSEHDINLLLSRFLPEEFSFEHTWIPADMAAQWKQLGCSAEEAGYWFAHGIEPMESVSWKSIGIAEYGIAAEWRLLGFSPQGAAEWVQYGLSSRDALLWGRAGYPADRARYYLDKGLQHPSDIPPHLR